MNFLSTFCTHCHFVKVTPKLQYNKVMPIVHFTVLADSFCGYSNSEIIGSPLSKSCIGLDFSIEWTQEPKLSLRRRKVWAILSYFPFFRRVGIDWETEMFESFIWNLSSLVVPDNHLGWKKGKFCYWWKQLCKIVFRIDPFLLFQRTYLDEPLFLLFGFIWQTFLSTVVLLWTQQEEHF